MQSRRVFLKQGGFALVSLGFAPTFLARTAQAAESTPRRVLVAVFQRGAVDGLNMIVPHGERLYYDVRPTIAIPRPGSDQGAIDLDGFFGLHPRLAALGPLWRNRALAIVAACGSPDPTRSHFDAQDYMETATPGVKNTDDGWINRYLRTRQLEAETPFRAVALASQLPRALQGSAPAIAISRLDGFGLRAGDVRPWQRNPRGGHDVATTTAQSFEQQYAEAADQLIGHAGSEAFEAVRMMKTANPGRYRPENGAQYPPSPFGEAMRQIAQLIKAEVGLEVAFTESGNWDHHVNEGSTQGQIAQRLDDFGRGLGAFAVDLGDAMADVVVLTMSEFGRTVRENGSRGTDHGHGNAMMAFGGSVRGGKVYGRWPGLDVSRLYEGRDLAVTTDFRDVFGEVVVRHLGVKDPRQIFPGYAISPARFPGFLA